MKELKLTIELVPKSSFYHNVRSEVSTAIWDKIRKFVYKRANYKCEICGEQGDRHPVECHEIWEYFDARSDEGVQTLIKFIALCPRCHQVKHLGLSRIRGLEEQAIEHLININECTDEEASAYIDFSFEVWNERSQMEWEVDVRYLDKFLEEIT